MFTVARLRSSYAERFHEDPFPETEAESIVWNFVQRHRVLEMYSANPPPPSKRRPRSKESVRRRECRLSDPDHAIPIPPPELPPTPPPTASSKQALLTPNCKESAKFSTGSAAFRSKILSSTPYPPDRVARKSTPSRRASPFPLLIPTELTLSIVRESPLTAVEELTCGDHIDGKEDAVSSPPVITERQCAAYGTPRGTSAAATAATTAGVSTVEEILESTEHTMGACTSKKSSGGSGGKSGHSPPTAKPQKPPKPSELETDEVNDEDDPAAMPKFKLKRDSIAVTKVRLLKTQIHQENTIGEEEEDDDDERDDSGRGGEDHVHFGNHVSKQSIPNDSGVSLSSCPDSDLESVCEGNRRQWNQDFSSIRFDGKLDCDVSNEISLASNVTIRSLRKERIVDDDNRSFDFKSILERAKQLVGNQTESEPRRPDGVGMSRKA